MSKHNLKSGNIFTSIPTNKQSEELIQTLLQGSDCKLERIVSMGHTTPQNEWYDQEQDEWVILLKGHATLLFECGRKVDLKSGDYLFIEAHHKHRVSWTHPNEICVWLALHYCKLDNIS